MNIVALILALLWGGFVGASLAANIKIKTFKLGCFILAVITIVMIVGGNVLCIS